MYANNHSTKIVLLIGILVLTTIAAVGFYFTRPQSIATANDSAVMQAPSIQYTVQDTEKTNQSVEQLSTKDELSKVKNEITVEITSAKIIKTGVEIGICYTEVDDGDWYPMPGHLFYSTYEIYPDEFELTTETLATKTQVGNRCALVRYRIDDTENITTPVKFSILQMTAIPREMYTPCQEVLQRLETNSKANAYGITAKCTENSDGVPSVTLDNYGQSVKVEMARGILDEIAKGVILGPWEFTISDISN